MITPAISIIVPVLNEADIIAPFLRHLRKNATDAELIVVDGDSVDGTATLAKGFCDHVLVSERGRAV